MNMKNDLAFVIDTRLYLYEHQSTYNPKYNRELLQGCQTLKEYAQYIQCIRQYLLMGEPLENAVAQAVDECIQNGILAEFLIRNKAEAIKMSIYEYNEAEEKEKYKRTMNEYWKEQGLAAGREQGLAEGLAEGKAEGLAEGIVNGKQAMLFELINKKLQKGKSLEIIAEELDVS